MTEFGDDDLTLARTELGEPDVLFQVDRARFLTKLGIGLTLFFGGILGNYLWWVHGPATLNHVVFHLMYIVPLSGLALLWHMYRNRGLLVLIYPTGLLRLRRGEVDSFPWSDVEHIRVKVQRAEEATFERNVTGTLTACWLPAEVPNFQLWAAGLVVVRNDGTEAHFGPVLSDYAALAETVQKRSFAALWPAVWSRFESGQAIEFEELLVTPAGIRHERKLLPWKDLKEITVAQSKLNVKQTGKWLPWALKDANSIPNLHILFALVAEARQPWLTPPSRPQSTEKDHTSH